MFDKYRIRVKLVCFDKRMICEMKQKKKKKDEICQRRDKEKKKRLISVVIVEWGRGGRAKGRCQPVVNLQQQKTNYNFSQQNVIVRVTSTNKMNIKTHSNKMRIKPVGATHRQ
ncbi:hypothetical protein F2P81_021752 [Scophthalmus maximus]|uniref:Uncharacterized protein n=1 Tax=Scophthalmus maximus TaxID=52904 RepID=A0A6A4S447_SCOMX|nr:hypothetical protein F2P81_021752 [Scophthalmus maximus]